MTTIHRKITLTVVGLDGIGKGNFVCKIAGQPVTRSSPESEVQTTHLVYGKYAIKLLDVPGAANKRNLWKYYFPFSHGIIFVYDTKDMDRIDEANMEMDKLLENITNNKPVLILTMDTPKTNSKNFSYMQTEVVNKSGKIKNLLKGDFSTIMNAIDNNFHILNDEVIKATEVAKLKKIKEDDERVNKKKKKQRESKAQEMHEEVSKVREKEDLETEIFNEFILNKEKMVVEGSEKMQKKSPSAQVDAKPFDRGDGFILDMEETEQVARVKSSLSELESDDSICEEIESNEELDFSESPCENMEETWNKLIYSDESLCDQLKFQVARGSSELLTQVEIEEQWNKLLYSDESLSDQSEATKSQIVKHTTSEESIYEDLTYLDSPSDQSSFTRSPGDQTTDSEESICELIVRKETPWEKSQKSLHQMDSEESICEVLKRQPTPAEKLGSDEGSIEDDSEGSIEDIDSYCEVVKFQETSVEELASEETSSEYEEYEEVSIDELDSQVTLVENIDETMVEKLESEEALVEDEDFIEGAVEGYDDSSIEDEESGEASTEGVESEEKPIEDEESEEASIEDLESEEGSAEGSKSEEALIEGIESQEVLVKKTDGKEFPIELGESPESLTEQKLYEETIIEKIMELKTPDLECEETTLNDDRKREDDVIMEESTSYSSDEFEEEIDDRAETGSGECREDTPTTDTTKKQKKTRKFGIKPRKVDPHPELPYLETPRQMEMGDNCELQ